MNGDIIAICALGTVALGVGWWWLTRQAGIDKAKRAQAEANGAALQREARVTRPDTPADLADRLRKLDGQ